MGLDMYLKESQYVGHWNHTPPKEHKKAETIHTVTGLVNPLVDDGFVEVTALVARWRKASAIHGWFVANVQNGVDNCQGYEVSIDELDKLVHDCTMALLDPAMAESTIPPVDGFFFGMNRDNPMDEYYREDLQNTIEMLAPIIARSKEAGEGLESWNQPYFEYEASW